MTLAALILLPTLLNGTPNEDVEKAFAPFVTKLERQGYFQQTDPRDRSRRDQPSPSWKIYLTRGEREIRAVATVYPTEKALAEGVQWRLRSIAAAHMAIKDLDAPGTSFYWLGRPYTYVADIVHGRLHVELWQIEKDPGGGIEVKDKAAERKARQLLESNARELSAIARSLARSLPRSQ